MHVYCVLWWLPDEFLANVNIIYLKGSEIYLECFYMNFRKFSIVLDAEILLNLS